MITLDQALAELELTHHELVSENPADFDKLEVLVRGRALAVEALLALMQHSELAPAQVARLKRVHLGGLLSLERIRFARRAVREELASLSQQGRVLSGYLSGSSTQL